MTTKVVSASDGYYVVEFHILKDGRTYTGRSHPVIAWGINVVCRADGYEIEASEAFVTPITLEGIWEDNEDKGIFFAIKTPDGRFYYQEETYETESELFRYLFNRLPLNYIDNKPLS